MSELLTFSSLIAFLTLLALEIVLGVDNVVFIAVVSGRLPESQRPKARNIGLALAAIGRIILLLGITWVMRLEGHKLFEVNGVEISLKDVILIVGGMFLVGKATWEIHHSLEGEVHDPQNTGGMSMGAAIGQILVLDLVFSIDSVLTAVGMVKPDEFTHTWVPLTIMITAIVGAIAVMLGFAGPLSRFVERHPTMKMLALAFLILIGVILVAEGVHHHVPRGYIYFAMAFSLGVELLNLRMTARRKRLAAKAKQATV